MTFNLKNSYFHNYYYSGSNSGKLNISNVAYRLSWEMWRHVFCINWYTSGVLIWVVWIEIICLWVSSAYDTSLFDISWGEQHLSLLLIHQLFTDILPCICNYSIVGLTWSSFQISNTFIIVQLLWYIHCLFVTIIQKEVTTWPNTVGSHTCMAV